MGTVQSSDEFDRLIACSDGKKYAIEDRVGRGNFSDVYRAREVNGNGGFAVKIIKKDITKRSLANYGYVSSGTRTVVKAEEIMNRFVLRGNFHEFRILRELSHPAIVKCYAMSFYRRKNIGFVVMEYIPGRTLYQRLLQKEFYEDSDARFVIRTVCNALQYMHTKGIFHRDLKPENIMVSDHNDVHVKIIDFGLASYIPRSRGGVVDKIIFRCGSPSSMAPEMLQSRPYDEAVDMWALGVLAYEISTGYGIFREPSARKINMKLIQDGSFHKRDDFWPRVRTKARSFISALLKYKSEQRLTASAAAEHPWLTDKKRMKRKEEIQNTTNSGVSSRRAQTKRRGEEEAREAEKTVVIC